MQPKEKLTSFFDDDAQKIAKKIWQKVNKNCDNHGKIKESIQNIFIKRTKKPGKAKIRVLLLDDKFLYMSKSDKTEKISG